MFYPELFLTSKPQIVCLTGSTRFKDEYEKANKLYTMQGVIVLTVGWLTHEGGSEVTTAQKKHLDKLHLRKIDLCDYVCVLNKGGYIGESTQNEIAYAQKIGKAVCYLEKPANPEAGTGDQTDPLLQEDNEVSFNFLHLQGPLLTEFTLQVRLPLFKDFDEDDYDIPAEMLQDICEWLSIPPRGKAYNASECIDFMRKATEKDNNEKIN